MCDKKFNYFPGTDLVAGGPNAKGGAQKKSGVANHNDTRQT
jgi:hypothetical protein